MRGRIFFFSGAILLAAANARSQDSSSNPGGSTASASSETTAADGPSAALKAVLSAACSQNQTEFVRFLTVRNQEAFSRMTSPARVALMRRFVLLDEPGKPTASGNPVGRPLLRCQTPEVTTEMVREDGEWKLLSLGLLLLDLPALEVEWDAAEMETTERNAIEALNKVSAAVELYRNKYLRLPESLANLGPPLHGAANGQAAGLLDSDLANGMKSGYAIRYVIVGASTLGAPAKYELAATPLQYGRTGRRSLFRDSHGALHAADRRGAVGSEADPKVE